MNHILQYVVLTPWLYWLFYSRDWGYCLDDEPSEHPFNFPVLPPGVMYDIDHQCRLQYGQDAEFCEGIDVSVTAKINSWGTNMTIELTKN